MRSLASDIAIVLLLLFVALGFRAPCMDESLWLDELHTGWTINQAVADIAPRARMGNNLPLYFHLVRSVTTTIGNSEFALRLPSLIAGLAAIATGYVLIRRWTGSVTAAAVTAVIMMVDPHFLFYSVEARPYALLQWIGLMQVAAFLAWVEAANREPDNRGAVLAGTVWLATTTLLFSIHCTSVLLPLAQLPLALIFFRSTSSRFRFGIAFFAFLGLALFTIPTLLEIYSRRKAWSAFIPVPSFADLLTLFPIAYLLIPAATMFVDSKKTHSEEIETTTHDTRPAGFDWRRLFLIGLMFALPMLFAFFLTQIEIRLFLRRYVIVVSGLPMLIGGLLIGRIQMTSLRYGTAMLTVAVVVWAGPYSQLQRDGRIIQRSRENWRSTVAFLNERTQPGDVIFIASDLIESDRLHDPKEADNAEFCSYCALPLTGFYGLRQDVKVVPVPMNEPERFTATLNDGQGVTPNWIVSRRLDNERIAVLVPPGASVKEHRDRSPTIVEIEP